jgi:hypothetical protein
VPGRRDRDRRVALHIDPTFAQTATQGVAVRDAVQVKATDKATRTVTLKGEGGRVVPVQVDPAVKAFDTLKVGDTVTATCMVAVAAQIAKPGQPMAGPKAGDEVELIYTEELAIKIDPAK